MTGAHIQRILLFVIFVAASLLYASGARPDDTDENVVLTPGIVVAGSPELVRVAADGSVTVDGEWMGRKLEFFRGRAGKAWFALAGVDVQAPAGPSVLHIALHTAGAATIDLNRTIEIHPANYRAEKLTVAPKYVEPGTEELKRIKAEAELKKKVFEASAPEVLWSGDFRAPIRAAATDSFGLRRTYNGELNSIHKGMDFRARKGTVVRADNSGVVVLGQSLYYEGNCVVIDHGLGLFTIEMHLSRIDVRVGQQIVKGQRVGLSGATGRVTGPHLHWAVWWQGAYLDPAKLLRMDLSRLR